MRNILFWIATLSTFLLLPAQTNEVTVIDSKTKEPLIGVNITWGQKGEGMVSDSEGKFNKNYLKNINGALRFSYVGYKDLEILVKQLGRSVAMELDSKTLSEVVVSKRVRLSANQIIDSVNFYLKKNHNLEMTNRRFFLRQVDEGGVSKLDIHVKKSTIKEFDDEFAKKLIEEMPKTNDFLTEITGHHYGDLKKQKLQITEGYKAYDTEGNGYLEQYYKKLESIINKHVKSDSYFKVRTGIISFKTDVDEALLRDGELVDLRNDLGSEKKRSNAFLNDRKDMLDHIFEDVFLRKDSEIDFLYDNHKYDFEYVDDITFEGRDAFLLKFEPNSNRKYKGSLIVSEEDFAILKADVESIKPLMTFSLLGLSFKHKANNVTVVFEKSGSQKYDIKYIRKVADIQFGIDRPFVVTEKNKQVKGRRTQNKVKFDMEMIGDFRSNFDYVVLDSNPIHLSKFQNANDSNAIDNKDWSRYKKGDFWKSHPEVLKAKIIINKTERINVNF